MVYRIREITHGNTLLILEVTGLTTVVEDQELKR